VPAHFWQKQKTFAGDSFGGVIYFWNFQECFGKPQTPMETSKARRHRSGAFCTVITVPQTPEASKHRSLQFAAAV
jgi:hypothetical protein